MYVHRALTLGLTWTRVGRRPLTAANTKWLEGHDVIDVNARIGLWRRAQFIVTVKNIGGGSYYDLEDFPIPGRTIMMAIDLSMGRGRKAASQERGHD